MKNKKIFLILLICIFLFTGCTKYMSDDNNKKITNKETGQTLPSNILCKPTEKEVLKKYEANIEKMQVKLDKLPACKNFKVNSLSKNYSGLWEVVFVKPLAFVIIKLGLIINNYGVALMILGLLIRLALFPFSKNSINQSENMKKAQPEINRINKKYADKTDKESTLLKSQETMAVYKKYNIKPVAGCLVAFIQLPIFLGFLEAINRVPAIFEASLFNFKIGKIPFHIQLGTTPLVGIKSGNYIYIALVLILIATTYFSLRNTMQTQSSGESDPAQKQSQLMSKIMIVLISIASLSLPSAIGIYWITTNAFTVFQNLLVKKRSKK